MSCEKESAALICLGYSMLLGLNAGQFGLRYRPTRRTHDNAGTVGAAVPARPSAGARRRQQLQRTICGAIYSPADNQDE